jgi:hypothetical protein
MTKIFFTLCIFLLSTPIFAQIDAGLKGLLTPTGEIKFPLSIKEASKKLNSKAIIITDTIMGDRCQWELKSGLVLATQQDFDNTFNFLNLTTDSNNEIAGLPYGLILHKSTLTECVTKFKAYKPKKTKFNSIEDESVANTLLFKKGKIYVLLSFNNKNKLSEMRVSSFDPNAAG